MDKTFCTISYRDEDPTFFSMKKVSDSTGQKSPDPDPHP